jgi:hypothetical protein
MDRFPEAFERFKRFIDLKSIRSVRELKYAFSLYAGKRWIDSYAQNKALEIEAEKIGIIPRRLPRHFQRPRASTKQTWRFERVNVRGKPQTRYRDLKTGRFIKKP